MVKPGPESDGLELVLDDIRKNIRDNKQFLDFLKSDQDVDLPDEEDEELACVSDDEFEEL